ncbi:MAG: protoheme IX farnesyltransferase [Elusimicrobia bacterium]|nr:protoheme IX farnesyltransferase [Elusimicrobiota bacterium]
MAAAAQEQQLAPAQELIRPGLSTVVSRLADYGELIRPRLNFLVVLTTLIGFQFGLEGEMPFLGLIHLLLATALLAGGSSALNQLIEQDTDARMRRTQGRPIPAGRLNSEQAFVFGMTLSVTGFACLVLASNWLTAALGALTWSSYLLAYTPLKKRTPWALYIGAVPGALPPVMGWTAAQGHLGLGAVFLFTILFFWQIPHFLAIALMHREDYGRAGLPLFPLIDPNLKRTGRHIVFATLALFGVSAAVAFCGLAGASYLSAALILGVVFGALAIACAREKTTLYARYLFLFSIVYLPVLLALLAFDKNV